MPASQDFWDDLLGHLKDRALLPVIGPELVTVQDGERRVALSQLLGERLAERYELAARLERPSRSRRRGERLPGRQPRQPAAVSGRQRSGGRSRIRCPRRRCVSWREISDFRLFVSTTFDSLLTRALNETRFGGEPRARDLWFSPNQSTAEQQEHAKPPRDDETVVFRLFGKASSTPSYALHDEDVLEWLHTLLTDTARLPEWLVYRLKESPMLFLGCQLSDWVGRLLTRMTSRNRLSLTNKPFFIVGESIARYPGLTAFFRTFAGGARVQVLEADPVAFVGELHARWTKSRPAPVATDHDSRPGRRREQERRHLHQLRPRGRRRGAPAV